MMLILFFEEYLIGSGSTVFPKEKLGTIILVSAFSWTLMGCGNVTRLSLGAQLKKMFSLAEKFSCF